MFTDYRLFASGNGIAICCVRTAARPVAINDALQMAARVVLGKGHPPSPP